MNPQKKYHAFLGLAPPAGLIPKWRALMATAPKSTARLQPWYRLHLTLHFWGAVTRSDFFELLSHLRRWKGSAATPESQICGVDVFTRHSILYFRETSRDILHLHDLAQKFIVSLPDYLHGEVRKEFTPHWTIARKFHRETYPQLSEFFLTLENFRHSGRTPAIELYFSEGGTYEAHPLKYFQQSRV